MIDFDIFSEHKPGVDPVTIKVTDISSHLRRGRDEQENKCQERARNYFASQEDFGRLKSQLEERFKEFLDGISKRLDAELGIEKMTTDRSTCLIRKGQEGEADHDRALFTGYGHLFYGFDVLMHIYYLSIWSDLFYRQGLEARDFGYVDPDGRVLTEVGEEG